MDLSMDRRPAEGRHGDGADRRRSVSLPRSLAYLALAAAIIIALGSAAFAALAQ
jgi:hypothetical protein